MDQAPPRATPVASIATVILWVAVGIFGCFGLLFMVGAVDPAGSDPAGRGISQGIGFLIMLDAAGAAGAMLLARRRRAWLIVAAAILLLPFALAFGMIGMQRVSTARYEQQAQRDRSGETDFGHQPALAAVARAISQNDAEAIRVAAAKVPDLNAPGHEGKTLLYFAADEAMSRPELVTAVTTLLSLGADPNHTNGSRASFALDRAACGSLAVLKAMLEAGGNPNARDADGNPIIFSIWEWSAFEDERRARLALLLDRGADINSAYADHGKFPGYTLVMARAQAGIGEPVGYADALYLLGRGADFTRSTAEGMTLANLLLEHRESYGTSERTPPPEYGELLEWLRVRGAFPE